MICPNCKNNIQDNSIFCNYCGFSFQNQQNIGNIVDNAYKTCPSCKSEIPKGSRVCKWCGFSFGPNNINQSNVQKYSNTPIPTKKSGGCLSAVLLIIVLSCIYSAFTKYKNNENDITTIEETTEADIDYSETNTEEDIEKAIATVDDEIIYEGNDIIIELKSLEGNKINLYIENNSSKNLSSSLHAYAVNGFMADNNMYDMYKSISANSKANISFEIPKELESGYVVDEIKRIDLLIWFYDKDISYKAFDTGIITVETSLADGKLDNDIGNNELLNENDISYKLVEKNEDKLVIGINNNSDNFYAIDGKNVVVNGYSLDTTYNLDIYDKIVFPQCSYTMTFEYNWNSSEDFKKVNGIEKIENVSVAFDLRPNEDGFSEISSSNITVEY